MISIFKKTLRHLKETVIGDQVFLQKQKTSFLKEPHHMLA